MIRSQRPFGLHWEAARLVQPFLSEVFQRRKCVACVKAVICFAPVSFQCLVMFLSPHYTCISTGRPVGAGSSVPFMTGELHTYQFSSRLGVWSNLFAINVTDPVDAAGVITSILLREFRVCERCPRGILQKNSHHDFQILLAYSPKIEILIMACRSAVLR